MHETYGETLARHVATTYTGSVDGDRSLVIRYGESIWDNICVTMRDPFTAREAANAIAKHYPTRTAEWVYKAVRAVLHATLANVDPMNPCLRRLTQNTWLLPQ